MVWELELLQRDVLQCARREALELTCEGQKTKTVYIGTPEPETLKKAIIGHFL